MANFLKTGATIDLGEEETIDTTDLLEELGISYNTLAGRIRACGFPRPIRPGRNGDTAQYDIEEVYAWLEAKSFTTVRTRLSHLHPRA